MKVLHVIWDLGQGGCQRYLLDLLKVQARQKISCEVLVLTREQSLDEDVAGYCEGIRYIRMKSGGSVGAARRLYRYLQSCRADVIHSHTDNVIFNLVVKSDNRPLVYTEHGGRLLKRRIASKFLYRFLYRRVSRFIAISGFMRGVMTRENPIIAGRIEVIYNGVDEFHMASILDQEAGESSTGIVPPGPKVGFVGRLVAEKGVDHFLAIVEAVSRTHPQINFLVIGEGPERKALEAYTQGAVANNLYLLGYQPDARYLMKSLDLLLLTSRVEAFGLVLAEAMALGVPCVALENHSAVAEIVRDSVDGVVVGGLDYQKAANAVIELVEDRVLREKMSRNGQERVRREFTMTANAEHLRKVYQQVLSAWKLQHLGSTAAVEETD